MTARKSAFMHLALQVNRFYSGHTERCLFRPCAASGRTRNPEPGASWPTSSDFREESLCIVVSFVMPWRSGASVRRRLPDRAYLGVGELGVDEELERVELLVLLHEVVQHGAAQPG